ncbi:MAG: amidohydrolase, partial [Chloroflexota bacterium]|nr:amidohydrolase [Chloroflexota bacterium]
NMVPSTPLTDRWAEHLRALGIEVMQPVDDERMGSTDMGNVSQVVPAAHPYIAIAPDGTPGHSTAFRDAAGTPEAHANAIAAAKALALTAVDLLAEPALLARARAEFEERQRAGMVRGR